MNIIDALVKYQKCPICGQFNNLIIKDAGDVDFKYQGKTNSYILYVTGNEPNHLPLNITIINGHINHYNILSSSLKDLILKIECPEPFNGFMLGIQRLDTDRHFSIIFNIKNDYSIESESCYSQDLNNHNFIASINKEEIIINNTRLNDPSLSLWIFNKINNPLKNIIDKIFELLPYI